MTLGNSSQEQDRLRAVALWAAFCVDQVLPIYERAQPGNTAPHDAVRGAREFGAGARRDKALRTLAWQSHAAAGKARSKATEYVARAAMFAAAVAYTHTEITEGQKGIRQARHLLAPLVYAALALDASDGESASAERLAHKCVAAAPPELRELLHHMPEQREGKTKIAKWFVRVDRALRASESH